MPYMSNNQQQRILSDLKPRLFPFIQYRATIAANEPLHSTRQVLQTTWQSYNEFGHIMAHTSDGPGPILGHPIDGPGPTMGHPSDGHGPILGHPSHGHGPILGHPVLVPEPVLGSSISIVTLSHGLMGGKVVGGASIMHLIRLYGFIY